MSTARATAAWITLLVVALVFKSFVPLLAAASAHIQGVAVADVCSIYGVRLPPASEDLGASPRASNAHASMHLAGMGMPADLDAAAPEVAHGHEHRQLQAHPHEHEHDPANHADHAQDHCALSGLAAGAILTYEVWLPTAMPRMRVSASHVAGLEPPWDATARWLTLRLHAPPPLA